MYSKNSIKNTAESLGIGKLKDEVTAALAQDVESRIKLIIEDAKKFMRHSKRNKLQVSDINRALKVKNLEPIYGYDSKIDIKYKAVSTPYEDIFYEEEEELDLFTLVSEPLPSVPQEIEYTAHWLAIEGVQPNIPQNPISLNKEQNYIVGLSDGSDSINNTKDLEQNNTAPLVKHVLSKEHQLYFECVKDSLFSSNAKIQMAALDCVSSDGGIHQLVPYFIQLISDLVRDIFAVFPNLKLKN
ncbi:Transcription initiation factor TFIID subunit 6 [Smittium culicis]|uniref:Transcription initiation factor TFIID subunit 6 n=1 Tax=Smittium culicis TaxID=133412 RepID=A0A1R1YB57_9FUNG|nr:Transcription initiation factor TFIID subunit 6 [Smittium culicis]